MMLYFESSVQIKAFPSAEETDTKSTASHVLSHAHQPATATWTSLPDAAPGRDKR